MPAVSKAEGQRARGEMEPRVDYDKLIGDGAHGDACVGEQLPKEMVTKGRTEEMTNMDEFDAFERVPYEDWMNPFHARRVDSKKCDLQNLEWIARSRRVHRRCGDGFGPTNFAGTPAPLAAKLALSRAATHASGGSKNSRRTREKKLGRSFTHR